MIIGYLDNNQRNISTDEQRDIVNQYACNNAYNIDIFINDPDIKNIKDNINSKENMLIMANIACLGSKLAIIVENIEFLVSNGFELISVKENLKFDSSNETTQLLNGIKLSIDIRNSMVSTITKKALNDKRAQGYKLGRDFGYKHKRYIWEGKEADIKNKLLSGMTRQQTADEVGMSVGSLYNYLKLNPELKNMTDGGQHA
ncbi:MAG: hypothetical protein IKC10_06255 [Alphaproteobacteria bacterium]|nr:hypothetical protein [Alphaproteobacteria bacterium]